MYRGMSGKISRIGIDVGVTVGGFGVLVAGGGFGVEVDFRASVVGVDSGGVAHPVRITTRSATPITIRDNFLKYIVNSSHKQIGLKV